MTIYKYPLQITGEQRISVPVLVERILSVGLDPSGVLCVWVLVLQFISSTNSLLIQIAGTGHPISDEEDALQPYIGSVTQDEFVWHIFGGTEIE